MQLRNSVRPVGVLAACTAAAALTAIVTGPAYAAAPAGRPAAASTPSPVPAEAPGAPVVRFVTSTAVWLTWAPPARPAAPIVGYDVVQASSTPMGPSRVLVRTDGPRPAAVVTGLYPGTTYQVYVVARHPAYGSSPESPRTAVTTAGRPPAEG